MKTTLFPDHAFRSPVGEILNLILADESVLYATTRDYYWNVTGPGFASHHRDLEIQFVQLADRIDEIADRCRLVGGAPNGNWTALVLAARTSAEPGIGLPARRMFIELLALHETLILQLRRDAETCVHHHDASTADFLHGLMERHEKTAWTLRSQLENEDADSPAPARTAAQN